MLIGIIREQHIDRQVKTAKFLSEGLKRPNQCTDKSVTRLAKKAKVSDKSMVAYWQIFCTSYPLSMVVFPADTAAVNSNGVLPVSSPSELIAALNSCNSRQSSRLDRVICRLASIGKRLSDLLRKFDCNQFAENCSRHSSAR